MKKTKKRLLGFIGLAVVAVITIIACTVSDPAKAEGPTTSHTDEIRVLVHEKSSIEITNPPLDEESLYVVSNPAVPVTTEFTDANNITYYLSFKGMESSEDEIEIRKWCALTGEEIKGETVCPDFGVNPEGTDTFVLDLKKIIDTDGDGILDSGWGYGEYSLRAVLSDNGADTETYTTKFVYGPVSTTIVPDEKNGDPIITVTTDEGVNVVKVEVQDEKGKTVYGPIEIDVKQCIQGAVCTYNPETGGYTIKIDALPFEKDGMETGRYQVIVTAYGDEGLLYKPMVWKYRYIAVPVTPDTGGLMTKLNISRVDYLITGLIVFGAVAGFGTYLIARNKRRR